jgi:hypothetical protein
MKSVLFFLFLLVITLIAKAQKVDSIYFHLYTDSLKKGTYNYINVDGKLSNGNWLPLTTKQISLTASAGTFDGNSLFVDRYFAGEKITVKAMLKENNTIIKETTIYIKRKEDNERLKTNEEVLESVPKTRKSKTKNRSNN